MAERQSLIDAYYPESLFRMTALRVLVGTEFELRKEPPVSGRLVQQIRSSPPHRNRCP